MSLIIQMHTLTPLWTGGVERDSSRPRETGLLGSLRWWYEGIVRGMGGYACEPVGDDRCEYDARKKAPPEKQLCPACWFFGCTGWQRRFRLRVDGLEPQPLFFVASKDVYQASGNWLWRIFGEDQTGGKVEGQGDETRFTFGVKALWGQEATLHVTPLQADSQPVLTQVAYLLDVMSCWGALGAKPQHGFGQVAFSGLDPELVEQGRSGIQTAAGQDKRQNDDHHFSLSHFFAHIYKVGERNPYAGSGELIGDPNGFDYEAHFVPCAFDVRYKSQSRNPFTGEGKDFGMRPWFRKWLGDDEIHYLSGRSGQDVQESERSASRVFVSHLYRTEPDEPFYLKVWGQVPPDLKDDAGRPVSAADVARQVTAFLDKRFPDIKLVKVFDRREVLGQ